MSKKKGLHRSEEGTGLTVRAPAKSVPTSEAGSIDTDWLDNGIVPPEVSAANASMSKMPGEVRDIPIDCVVPNPWNPNEQSPKEYDMLVRRLNDVGMIQPIQVVPVEVPEGETERYMILGGEHRYRAAKSLGWETIPCLVITDERFQNEDLQKFVTMQLNMIHGKLNPEKFLKLYEGLEKKYDKKALQDLFAFTDTHKFKMMTDGIAEGLPDEMQEEFRRRASKTNDPNALKKIIDDLFGKYGDDLRYNFMIISHETQEHIWVKLNDRTHPRMKELLDLCRTRAVDINIVLEEVLTNAVGAFA